MTPFRIAGGLGFILLGGASLCFVVSEDALARTQDPRAAYWLLIGLVCLWTVKRMTQIPNDAR